VDDVHRAIAENKQIRLEYMKWNPDKKMERRRERPVSRVDICFGDGVKILSPTEVVERYKKELKAMYDQYNQ